MKSKVRGKASYDFLYFEVHYRGNYIKGGSMALFIRATSFLGFFLLVLGFHENVRAETVSKSLPRIVVYKSASCGCCDKWVSYLKENGFIVETHTTNEMETIKSQYGIAPKLQSCHTSLIGGYVIEGHVPVEAILKLLDEKPEIKGIAVPGMPNGSPGMEGGYKEAYTVYAYTENGDSKEFMKIDG